MRILILGSDGYIGWALANYLKEGGHTIFGIDNHSRRCRVEEVGSTSLIPIAARKHTLNFAGYDISTLNHNSFASYLKCLTPDTIVHLAQMPSAPWSMKSPWHAMETQRDNVLGTLNLLWAMKEACPDVHLVKLGTMGEYGTPDCDIPEGKIPEACSYIYSPKPIAKAVMKAHDIDFLRCPMGGLPFPRSPGSFYHLSKVHDTHNIIFACKTWGLTCTDIMQGVVFGNEYDTRFDYDEYFGTVINRFCVQAIIGHPLTVYGKGNQTRGFLPLMDSLKCLEIAIHNPPQAGEYRTLNQFENIYTINKLAKMVMHSALDLGILAAIEHIPNPRTEMEEHYYNPTHQKLFDLGYKPTRDIGREIRKLIGKLRIYKDRVIKEVIMPKTTWR